MCSLSPTSEYLQTEHGQASTEWSVLFVLQNMTIVCKRIICQNRLLQMHIKNSSARGVNKPNLDKLKFNCLICKSRSEAQVIPVVTLLACPHHTYVSCT